MKHDGMLAQLRKIMRFNAVQFQFLVFLFTQQSGDIMLSRFTFFTAIQQLSRLHYSTNWSQIVKSTKLLCILVTSAASTSFHFILRFNFTWLHTSAHEINSYHTALAYIVCWQSIVYLFSATVYMYPLVSSQNLRERKRSTRRKFRCLNNKLNFFFFFFSAKLFPKVSNNLPGKKFVLFVVLEPNALIFMVWPFVQL